MLNEMIKLTWQPNFICRVEKAAIQSNLAEGRFQLSQEQTYYNIHDSSAENIVIMPPYCR